MSYLLPKKRLADSYQRRSWSVNNWTKTLEEKKISGLQTWANLLWSEFLSRWGQKGKWATGSLTVWTNGYIQLSLQRQGFLVQISNSHCRLNFHRVWLCARHCIKACKGLVSQHSCDVGAISQPQTTCEETNTQSGQFTRSPQCFQKVEPGLPSKSTKTILIEGLCLWNGKLSSTLILLMVGNVEVVISYIDPWEKPRV